MTMFPDDDRSLRDEAWDENYFSLILELSEKNSSRYESQAETLLKNKTLVTFIEDVEIRYEKIFSLLKF